MKTYKERMQSILAKAEVQRKARNKKILTFSVLSGVLAVLLAFNLVLFVPYTVGDVNLSAYKSSEYYGVIQKLYGLTYSPHKTNNFTEWFGDLGSKKVADEGVTAPNAASESNYNEVTLNQTENVTEGDLFKRSNTHIFYLGYTPVDWFILENQDTDSSDEKRSIYDASFKLRIYMLAGSDSEQVAEYKILPENGTSFSGYGTRREMYLHEDLSTITVISPCYSHSMHSVCTVVINLDISDLSNICEKSRTYISGNYVSSRMVDGTMLVISDFTVRRNVNFDDVSQYVPQVGENGTCQPLDVGDIVCPDTVNTPRYTVICSLDGNLAVIDAVALLSFSDDVYVSENHLFTTHAFTESVQTNNAYRLSYTYNKSEICVIPYNGGELGDARAVTVSGTVLNRYSLDEYNGMLRAVTTVNILSNNYTYKGDNPYAGMFGDRCMLYCFDLDTLETVATVKDFAPVGESVKSARFYGDTAYVCTAEVTYGWGDTWWANDPVFAFDLSDINHITYKDTGTIPGYSLSLNGFAHDTLLGIGYGDNRSTLKIELYEQTEHNVTPIVKYEKEGVEFSSQFKAHFIDAKNGLIGLGIRDWNDAKPRYKLLRYDGYDLVEILSVQMSSLDGINLDSMRATVIDNYVYIFDNSDFYVLPIA